MCVYTHGYLCKYTYTYIGAADEDILAHDGVLSLSFFLTLSLFCMFCSYVLQFCIETGQRANGARVRVFKIAPPLINSLSLVPAGRVGRRQGRQPLREARWAVHVAGDSFRHLDLLPATMQEDSAPIFFDSSVFRLQQICFRHLQVEIDYQYWQLRLDWSITLISHCSLTFFLHKHIF